MTYRKHKFIIYLKLGLCHLTLYHLSIKYFNLNHLIKIRLGSEFLQFLWRSLLSYSKKSMTIFLAIRFSMVLDFCAHFKIYIQIIF